MGFKEELNDLIDKIKKLQDSLNTEEATKMSIIMPFFQILGYDIFNPLEVEPEFTADACDKKDRKVDYAIIIDGEPTILVECKPCKAPLDKHIPQLFQYFTVTPARFAILTNGIDYHFFTDLDKENLMDERPFLTINLLNLQDRDIDEIAKFSKAALDVGKIMDTAEELKFTRLIKEWISNEFKDPSLSFVKFVLSNFYDGVKTQNVINKFTPIVKLALSQYISDSMNMKIKAALIEPSTTDEKEDDNNTNEDATKAPTGETTPPPAPQQEAETSKSKINTTIEELEAYVVVKSILRPIVGSKRVKYKDRERYFNIYLDNSKKWICRVHYTNYAKHISIADDNKNPVQYSIESIDDIYKYSEEIIEACRRYL